LLINCLLSLASSGATAIPILQPMTISLFSIWNGELKASMIFSAKMTEASG